MDCASDLVPGSPEFLAEFVRFAHRHRIPLTGTLDLTYRCNFRCVHCYAGHLVAQSRAEAAEMDTQKAKDVLSAAAKAGCIFLLISGGEPLLRDDFVEIYTFARRLGLIVTVFSNASLLTQAHVDAFREYPPLLVEVSVYGATEATYERVTGVPGSFRRARHGVQRLLDGGVRVAVKTMILQDNAHEIADIEEWASGLHLKFRLDPLLTPRLNGDPAPLAQRVEPERAAEIELGNEARCGSYIDYLQLQAERREAAGGLEKLRNRLYLCGAGISSFHVDPAGVLRPCLMSRDLGYDIGKLGFAEAWAAATAAVDHATWEGTGGCADCPTIDVCGYCAGLFALEHASPSHPPAYVCRLGECRHRLLIQHKPGVAYVGID